MALVTEVEYLESHRFRIHDNSYALMSGLRSGLTELNQEFKVVEGLSFFGSRTRGFEHEYDELSGTPASDVDMAVFYDGSVFAQDAQKNAAVTPLVIDRPTVSITIDPQKILSAEDKAFVQKQFETDLRARVKERIGSLAGYPIDREDRSLWIVDTSKHATRQVLQSFYTSVYADCGYFSRDNLMLMSRFFLGVGHGLYKNRRYILNEFDKRPSGDELFAILMGRLSEFERTRNILQKKRTSTIAYEGYPTTIVDAEHYFLVK